MESTTNYNFSVLLTVYIKDNPDYLKESLDSILSQTLLPNEVVIVEDGSVTENLREKINCFRQKFINDTKIVSLPINIGTGLAINEGLMACSYDLVAKMDSDDVNFPTRFEKQIEVFKKDPEISFLSAGISEFELDDLNNIIAYRILPEFHDDIVRYAKKRCPLNQPVAMYKKSAIMACDGYRKFTFGEDYDLWVRAILKDFKFYNIQESLLFFRTNISTFKKRGSFWYLKIDLAHHYDFYKMGFLSLPQFICNSLVRIVVRLAPINLRKNIYHKFLRNK